MITITFASLELSSTVTRYTVIDGGFPFEYENNTYLNDGLVVALDKTVISAELANVTQNITLFLDNDVKDAIQTDTYRNRRAKIFKGEWDPSTSTLSSVRVIYEGLMDTHNTPTEEGTVELIISSLISPLRRPSDNISLQVLHNQRIADGVYGSANAIGPTVDTFLRNAGQSFQDFTLGASEYREAVTKPMYIKVKKNMFGNHKRKYVGEETVSPEIQETPGSQLETPASYQPARVYGVSGVNAAIVAAWNHSSENNYAPFKLHYGDNWRGFQDPESVNAIRPDTRFGTIVYLVHAGEVGSLNIYLDGLSGEVDSRAISLTSGTTGVHYLNDEYEDDSGTTRNNTYAAVEVLWGENNQTPPATWLATSGGEIDANFRGLGYVLVAITFEATRDGAVSRGIPEVGFQVKQTSSIALDINAWSETAIASQVGLTYDNTSPYSSNSFYVENFAFWVGFSSPRTLTTGKSFKSSFSNSYLKVNPSSAFAADIDTAYGLSSSTTFAFNFSDGIKDIDISQGSNYGKFKILSVRRNTTGTEYSFFLAGDKGSNGTINVSQTFDIGIEETSRTFGVTSLTTREENQHPARILVDYLLDKQVGPGLSEDDIDLESFLLCQENASKIPQYLNGVMQGKDSFVEYIQSIADTANLTLYQEGDKIKCRFRKPIDPQDVAVTFNENNASGMNLINFRNEDKFNEFILTVDLQRTSNIRAPRITGIPLETRDTGYLSQDNGIRSIGEFSSDWLTLFYAETVDEDGNKLTALDEAESSEVKETYEQYARFLMDISRFYEEIELTTTYDIAKDFTIGTPFDVQNELYGFTGNNIRRYEVVDYADNHDGTVSLVGQRHSNAIFGEEDDFSNNVFDSLEPTILPYVANSESAIPSAPSLTAVWEPISRRIDLSWTEPSTNAFNISHYQVQEKANSETEWTTISEQLVTSDRVFSRAIVERGGIYRYRVRALTAPGMINGPFSTEKYVRLDLAFGDNKPEQQKIVITGNRSNASVASAVDTTVTIGLPTNFEAAPADASGTGATSNLGNLGVDLDVTSDFIAAATDSDSGNSATSSTALPGNPSGGNYEVIDTFQSALTGSTSATDASASTGTFNLSNSAGSITIASDFSEATTGRFPATGTSTSTVSSQALSNGAGTLTVTSDFVDTESSTLSGEATHSVAVLTDLGTQTGSTSGFGTYNDIGTTTMDLVVSSVTATATTSSSGVGTKTQSGPDGTTARTAVVALAAGTFRGTGTGTLTTTFPISGTIVIAGKNAGVSNIFNTLTFGVNDGPAGLSLGDQVRVVINGTNYFRTYTAFNHNPFNIFEVTGHGFGSVSFGTGGSTTVSLYEDSIYSATSQTAGTDWSDNAATVASTTGVVSFPSQIQTKFELTNIPTGSDIDLVINGRTIDEANTSTAFGDTNTSRSWTLTGSVPSTSSGTNSPVNIGDIGTGQSNGLNLVQSGTNYILTNNYSKTLPKVVVTVGGVTSTINSLTSSSSSTIAIPSSGNSWTVTVSFPAGTYDIPNDAGTLTITEDVNGIASYILDRLDSNGNASGFTEGTGLTVDGVSRQDSYGNSGLTIRPWSVNISTPTSGSTIYTLVRPANFDQEAGIVLTNPDGSTSSFFSSKEDTTSGILPYFAISGKLQTGQTEYTFSPDSAFTDNQEFLLGGTSQLIGSMVPDSAAPRAYSVQATKPALGNTTYTFTPNTGFTGEWTIGTTSQGSGTHQVIDTTGGVQAWSIAASRPQSGGTTYELAGGPANLGIDLTVNDGGSGQLLTESSRSHTFIDADINRAWSATFDTTTFSLEVDPNDVVYVGNSYEIISQAITKGADEDDTLTEIANAVTAMDTGITWDSTISTNGTTGNREITIDLGTTSNIGFDIALGGKNSKNPNITDIETLGAGVNFSSYTLTSPDSGSTLNFNGFTIDATVADRNTVINEAVRQVDVNAEAPKDFLATSDGNSLIFTARTTGTSAGQWNFAWNHGSSTGNLRAKQYETDSDSTSSADNVDAEVVREGVADGTVNNTSFPSGTYDSTYTDAVRDERNFFAERAVIYSEGNTEPTVSITTTDYTWREVLSSG